MITISLCLSDIPKDRIKKSEKNGKMYVNLILSERKEKDEFGNTHSLSVSKTKEEREAKAATTYCGSGKLYEPQPAVIPTAEEINSMPSAGEDDLPF